MSALHHWFLPHHTNNQRAKLLHPSSWASIIGLLLLFQIVLGQTTVHLPQILGYAAQIPPEEVVRLTNVERTAQGLPQLTLNPQLAAAAAQKAADMMAQDYWAHVSPTGTQPWFFITQSGYNYRFAGENLARDFADSSAVVRAWMDSPSHRDNLLSSKYQDVGIAVVDGKLGGRETTLVVQMFGTKLSASQPSLARSGAIVREVKAAETTPEPTYQPLPTPTTTMIVASAQVSPFSLTKIASLGVIAVILVTLIVDIIMVRRKKITRWTSRSLAHLVFMAFLLIAAAFVYRGQII